MINDFHFDGSPLSDVRWPVGVGLGYALLAVALSKWVGSGSADTATQRDKLLWPIIAAHNVILCVGSFVVMLGCLAAVSARRGQEPSGARFLFCENVATEPAGALFFWAYIYYISKYYELLDTLLQFARGRTPPNFTLHVYHHACVLLMSWAWLEHTQSLSQIGLITNTAVHVVMYAYYLLRTLGHPPPWKRVVTAIQVLQFIVSLACLGTTCGFIYKGASCAGTGALVMNGLFNVTLLKQFIGVLVDSEPKPRKSKKRD